MPNGEEAEKALFIGIDLGGTKIITALVDKTGRIISRDYRQTEAAKGLDAVVARMTDAASAVMNGGGVVSAQISAVGVAAPGPIDAKSGVSGAGKKLKDMYLFGSLDNNFYAYGAAGHRHIGEMEQEIQKILTRRVPKNVFYTPTQWLDPVNLRKGTDSSVSDVLLSCPLYFDIDSNSIKRSILLSEKLIDIIFKEYSKKPDQIIFSGRRGFHIYYWDWEDIDFNILNPAKRIEKFSQTRERIIKDLHSKSVEVDSTVTSDPWRILRLPGTLHGVTGLAAIPISNFDYTAMIKRAKVLPKEAYSGLKEVICCQV